MTWRLLLATALMLAGPPATVPRQIAGAADPATQLDGAAESNGVLTLAPGPNVEGVVFLQGGRWPQADIETFHEVPWIDAASVRLRWAEFELADQQFDWVPLVQLAERYEVAYTELYAPDFRPLDVKHRIVEAFTQVEADAANNKAAILGFTGFRPWLHERRRTLYVREGVVLKTFRGGNEARPVERLVTAAETPKECSVSFRARTRAASGDWSPWAEASRVAELPPGTEVQIEARLHTDDGYVTPRILEMRQEWK